MRVIRSGGTSNCFLTSDRRHYGNVWSTSCNAWRKVHTFHGYCKDMRRKFSCCACARVHDGMRHVASVCIIFACTLEKSFMQNFVFCTWKIVIDDNHFYSHQTRAVYGSSWRNFVLQTFFSCLVRYRPFFTQNKCFLFAKLQHHTHQTEYCPTEQLPVKSMLVLMEILSASAVASRRPGMDGRCCAPLAVCRHPLAFAKNCFMVSGENTPGRGVGRNYWAECSEAFQGMYYWWNGE